VDWSVLRFGRGVNLRPGAVHLYASDVHKLLSDSPGITTVVGKGVIDCQPAQCTFNPSDAPCVLGDRASTTSTTVTAAASGGATLTLTSQPPSGLCGGYGQATVVTYTRF
jgi:hypothetical protein